MIQLIKKLIFTIRYRIAERKAIQGANKTGHKYFVILYAGKPKAVTKQHIKRMISIRNFKKGVSVDDIERVALFVSRPGRRIEI